MFTGPVCLLFLSFLVTFIKGIRSDGNRWTPKHRIQEKEIVLRFARSPYCIYCIYGFFSSRAGLLKGSSTRAIRLSWDETANSDWCRSFLLLKFSQPKLCLITSSPTSCRNEENVRMPTGPTTHSVLSLRIADSAPRSLKSLRSHRQGTVNGDTTMKWNARTPKKVWRI